MIEKQYQVALSFAGEQRPYAEKVAEHLRAKGIVVFYDEFEKNTLWGTRGAQVFYEIFSQRAFCVLMFISKEYINSSWGPRTERRATLEKAAKTERDYIIPVRFDNTPVPGLPEDIIYLWAKDFLPEELAEEVSEKLGIPSSGGQNPSPQSMEMKRNNNQRKASEVPVPRKTSTIGEVIFDYSNYNGRFIIGSGEMEFETMWSKASDKSIHVCNDPKSIRGVALSHDSKAIAEVENAEILNYTSRCRTAHLNQIVVFQNQNDYYAAVHVLEIKDDSRNDNKDEIRFRYAIQPDKSGGFRDFKGI